MNKQYEWEIDSNEDEHIGSWMITYSDMITILMCLFIMFFVMSAKENTKLSEIKDDLNAKVDGLEIVNEELNNENKELIEENQSLSMTLFQITDLEELETSDEEFISFLRENNLLNQITIDQTEKGLLIRFKNSILFDSGKSEITEQGYLVLAQIGEKLKEIDNDIIVEGYTDNIPMKSERFPSNWELSASRAINVVKYFIDNVGVDEERLAFSGWGERKSIADNTTAEGRAQNRRIEITILNN